MGEAEEVVGGKVDQLATVEFDENARVVVALIQWRNGPKVSAQVTIVEIVEFCARVTHGFEILEAN